MEPETGAFSQLQLSKTRSRTDVWRADDSDAQSRRSSARQSVISVADQWSKSRRTSTDSQASGRNGSTTSLIMRGQEVKRWDGVKRTTTGWDDLRRDPELWFPDGDCLIHMNTRGTARKGPALRLFRDDIEDWGFRSILSKFSSHAFIEEEEEDTQDDEGEDGGFRSNPKSRGKEELHIQAPPLLGRDDATKFHMTTRNLFAFLYEKPIVGAHLGEALVLMHERLNQYRPDKERNRDDMITYIDDQGYTEFRDCPDHAMGILYYAEKLRDTDLWTEAFVHCVGMYDILNNAIEFPTVSRTIGALITRAHLEMTLRLEHAFADLGNFMEDSVSSAYPKLPEQAIKHMDRFRSWLNAYYVQQHGYWPPPCLQPGADYNMVTKSMLRSIYADLRNLYAFLCDPKSEPKPTQAQVESYKAIYGGICMPAVIGAFDRRFKNTSLPNPLPLLPVGTSGKVSPITAASNLAAMDLSTGSKPPSGNALMRFLRPKQKKSIKALNLLNKLSFATNTNDQSVMDCLLVQEYAKFERDWTVRAEEKIDAVEARKVRWLLIYALLQTVIGVIVVPQEVAATENVEYPLCVQTGGTPPWRKRSRTKATFDGTSTPQLEALSGASSRAESPFLTPTTPGALSGVPSGAITPISAAGDIPPVPQLVLSELEKLQRDSYEFGTGSGRSTPADSMSVRSGKLQKKQKLKSSSASIRSERSTRSTRSSFGAMMNRSLYMGPGAAGSTPSVVSQTPSQATARPESRSERPVLSQQKSSPAKLDHEVSERRSRRGSIFGRMRSRTGSRAASRAGSVVGDDEREQSPPRQQQQKKQSLSAVTSPASPAQSTFSRARESVAESTPATTEFPPTAAAQKSQQIQPVSRSQPPRLPELAIQTGMSRSPTLPLLDTGLEPERGRALYAPASPSPSTPTKQKVRNFSRGRSMERPKSAGGVRSPSEAPPPIPSTTKPKSAASSRNASPAESRTYTNPQAPPRITSPLASPNNIPPVVNQSTKPVSRPTTPSRVESFHTPVEEVPLPPPIPFSSKPNSRSASPAPPVASRPPQLPLTQPVAAFSSQLYKSEQKQQQQQQQQQQLQYSPPPQESFRGRSTAVYTDEPAVQPELRRSRSRSLALRPAPAARAVPAAQPRSQVASANRERPVSNISESTDSGRIRQSRSVSPVSADESPDTSAEMLQRTTTNNSNYTPAVQYQPHRSEPVRQDHGRMAPVKQTSRPQLQPSERQQRQEAPVSHAVTTPDDTAHAAWNNPQQGSFHQALHEHEQKRASQPRQRRASSRESRYRRAAWAELGAGPRNEATGMPVPPPAVRQYGAPIVRDAPSRGYGYYQGDDASEIGYSDDESDGGVEGGMSSYAVKRSVI